MKTSRVTFNKEEVAAILPALEIMVNGIADARLGRYPRRQPTFLLLQRGQTYQQRHFDEEMAALVLSCRNKLKYTNASRKVRLNSFELSAAALALRVVRRQKLIPQDMIGSSVLNLESKLEAHRKRAKRAATKQDGLAPYQAKANRWRWFVQWLRYNLLSNRQRRGDFRGATLLQKEQRESMRSLAMEVVVETADQSRIHHLADLARREIRRRRHATTVRALLSDANQARQFLAEFIMEREDVELLRPEFQPECVRAARRTEKIMAALQVQVPATASVEQTELHKDTEVAPSELHKDAEAAPPELHKNPEAAPPESPIQLPVESGDSATTSRPDAIQLAPSDLRKEFAEWLKNEVDPELWPEVVEEIQYQVWRWADGHKRSIVSRSVAEVILECRPAEWPTSGFGMLNFYAGWGASWLLALNSDLRSVCCAAGDGWCLAREQWARMAPLTRQVRIDEIYRRYYA